MLLQEKVANMAVVTLRMDESILSQLDAKVKQYHHKRSDFIREAIMAKLEDLEDLESFDKTKNDKMYRLDEVRKNLGLAN